MEIKKQNIHMNYEKASAMSQITLDDDYNLPDYQIGRASCRERV